MTNAEIKEGFRKTIDQFYALPTHKGYKEEAQLHFIGGVLQSALHILPNKDYFDLRQYVYTQHGYDPGGCQDRQIEIGEYFKGDL